MAIAFDSSYTPDTLPRMKCGGTPCFDAGSGHSYRCDACFAVIGSISMPRDCYDMMKEEENKAKVWNVLES